MSERMRQDAPYPQILADLVAAWRYKPGWRCWLADEERGDDNGGLTLTILSSDTEQRTLQDGTVLGRPRQDALSLLAARHSTVGN